MLPIFVHMEDYLLNVFIYLLPVKALQFICMDCVN